MRTALAAATTLVLSTASAATAQGWVIPRPCNIERCPGPPSVVRTSSDVRVEMQDRVLRYEVTETFVNRGSGLGEADYFFPLPRGAAFQDLKLEIDGELVSGETMSAERARQIYEDIVRRQRDPALVEWMGYGLLRTRIFPIAPGEEKKVVVRFHAVAEREGDALRVDYFRGSRGAQPGPMPRLVDDARGDDVRPTPGRGERVSFVLTYPLREEVGTPYSPTHSLRISEMGARREVRVSGSAREVTILLPVRRRSEPSITVLTHAPGREEGFALITVAPPAVAPRTTPRDVTLVLDVSGSMSGRKMEQARAAGKQLLATLGPSDHFRLIDFSSGVHSFRDEPVPATRANIRAAEEYLDDLAASGGTNIAGALEEALSSRAESGRLSLVLFVTDGEPTVGERDPEAIAARVAELRRGRRVFTFGLGADVNVTLLEQLALQGRGSAHFVRPQESVERAVGIVANRLTTPVVTDVRLHAEGVRLSRLHPAMPVDIFAGQDLVILARYDGEGPARIRLEGESANGPVRWSTEVRMPERSRDNSFIPRLWATQRIGWLSAEKRRNGGTSEVDQEIRELGERYGIPTEFSSYLVLEPGMVAGARDRALRDGRGDARSRASGRTELAGAAGAAAAPAPTEAQSRFESAKRATEQRQAVTLDEADATARTSNAREAASTRRAGDRVFVARDGVWVDGRHRAGMRTLRIQAFSEAYFKVLELLPELREPLAIGDHVLVAGRDLAIEVGPAGETRLSERDAEAIRTSW